MKNVISDICPCPPVPQVLLGLMLRGVLITDNSRGTDMEAVFDERKYLPVVLHFKYLKEVVGDTCQSAQLLLTDTLDSKEPEDSRHL